MSEQRTARVSSLVRYLKRLTENDRLLQGIRVEGEISNLRIPSSGHWYFSLKDESASISCVMFSSYSRRLMFRPKNGDKVVVTGNVSVYEASGTLQIIVTMMSEAGIGDLYRRLEELKKKLHAEGLFDVSHKKPLPQYPMNIALVTGSNTAAREDVLITLKKRWPAAAVHEYPCPVQGSEAALSIIEALSHADSGGHDVILLVRGGGSIEDLWCFNDEMLARFIYNMHTPVVTGIGHEIDFTLADYTADLRANTPTGAVEAAVPDRLEVLASLQNSRARLLAAVQAKMAASRKEVSYLQSSYVLSQPQRLLSEKIQRLQILREKIQQGTAETDKRRLALHQTAQRFRLAMQKKSAVYAGKMDEDSTRLILLMKNRMFAQMQQLDAVSNRLHAAAEKRLEQENTRLQKDAGLLDAYSPLKILSRGYSIAFKGDTAVRSADQVETGDTLRIRVSDGLISGSVVSKEKLS